MSLISNLVLTCVMSGSLVLVGFPGEIQINTQDPILTVATVPAVPNPSKSMHPVNSTAHEQVSVQNPAKTSKDVETVLQRTVDWEYDEVPAIEVFEEIKESFDVNVCLDQSARDDTLTEDSLITISLKNVRMATALRLMLAQHNATYLIQDGILRIISLDVASDPEFFRRGLYDCRGLLQKIAATDKRIGKPVVVKILPVQGGVGGFGGGGGGGGVFNVQHGLGGGGVGGRSVDIEGVESVLLKKGQVEQVVGMQEVETSTASANSNDDPKEQKEVRNVVIQTPTAEGMLLELIRTLVAPDSWDETNGDGSMMIMSGFLFVAQQEDVLDEIGQLLSELEKSMQ